MKELQYIQDEPIVALATAWAESALAVIRVSGSLDLLEPCFSNGEKLKKAKSHTALYGWIIDPQTGVELDEVLLTVYRAPGGYTGEDSADISCHGSLPVIESILTALRSAGYRDAAPGEFTFRAFLHGKLDLTQAEAVQELVKSKSHAAQRLALRRLNGSLYDRIDTVKQKLLLLSASLGVELDYAEDEAEVSRDSYIPTLKAAIDEIRKLLETYRTGRLYQNGVRIALAGKTNAGKSSLFNIFLREDRSIVSSQHGTTRDYIESWIEIQGIPVSLFDTAGIRAADDQVEQEGIRRTEQILGSAELILYLVDGTEGLTEEDINYLENHECIKIWTKSDLNQKPRPDGFINYSNTTNEGFQEIENAILDKLKGDGFSLDTEKVVIDSLRQKELLERCQASLQEALGQVEQQYPADGIAIEVQDAMQALGEITGELSSTDVLNTMFGEFCLGK
jgi:tRNA modification GTPase